jgi:hypothetical protein
VTKTNRSRRRLPTRVPPPAESTKALLLRFCTWAQAHSDITDGEEAFVDRFLRETAPTFGRPRPEPRVAAPRAPGGAEVVETEAGEPGAGEGAEGASGGDVGFAQFVGAVIDRIARGK